jgi:hypothetical protein
MSKISFCLSACIFLGSAVSSAFAAPVEGVNVGAGQESTCSQPAGGACGGSCPGSKLGGAGPACGATTVKCCTKFGEDAAKCGVTLDGFPPKPKPKSCCLGEWLPKDKPDGVEASKCGCPGAGNDDLLKELCNDPAMGDDKTAFCEISSGGNKPQRQKYLCPKFKVVAEESTAPQF